MNISAQIDAIRDELRFPLREDLAWELIKARRESRGWGDGIDWDAIWEGVFIEARRWAWAECRRVPHPSYRRKVLGIALDLEHGPGGQALAEELERLKF